MSEASWNRPESTEPVSDIGDRAASAPAVTRAEERLQVGVRSVATERVRVRKVVVTEEVTQTVVIRREELRIDREPLGFADEAEVSGGVEDAAPLEIVLSTEKPVVRLEVVPVERVRVVRERITEQVPVSDDVRREQVVVDTDMIPE
ncbi:MAG: DUF2382 domain-containing protein [Actinomycetes bacterium]